MLIPAFFSESWVYWLLDGASILGVTARGYSEPVLESMQSQVTSCNRNYGALHVVLSESIPVQPSRSRLIY